jgi:hypothetical protein
MKTKLFLGFTLAATVFSANIFAAPKSKISMEQAQEIAATRRRRSRPSRNGRKTQKAGLLVFYHEIERRDGARAGQRKRQNKARGGRNSGDGENQISLSNGNQRANLERLTNLFSPTALL